MTKLNLQENLLNSSSFEDELINSLKSGKPLIGSDGVVTNLIKNIIEKSLAAELDDHLLSNSSSTNRKNGYGSKMVKSDFGKFKLETPRDRNASFNPEILPKGETVISESLDNHILKLYSSGMSYQDIRSTVKEIYGYETSNSFISKITDKIIPEIDEWRNRELESVYPIIFLDAMHFKGKDSKDERVKTKVLYNIMGINQNGYKEILGFYISDNGEGKHFWMQVLNDLKNRGVEDILISCIDGLKGFPDAIKSLFPETEIQLCIVHQIRNSLKYVSSKFQKEFMQDLKKIYKASTVELAENGLIELDNKWGKKYPIVILSWQNNWDNLTGYFKYSGQIRRLIYTTNPIESFHRRIRKFTKHKGAFTSEKALYKTVYLAINQIQEKWSQPIHNWAETAAQLSLQFGCRMRLDLTL